MHQAPAAYQQPGTRWKLETLLGVCDEWQVHTLPGLCQLLKRLKVCWKRARAHVHSPDGDYVEKLRWVRFNLMQIDLEGSAFLFQDELTFYRHPSLACAYAALGKAQPLAELGWKSNYSWRIAATLNAYTGQVIYTQAAHFECPQLVRFYQKVHQAYPSAQTLYMAQDNWPVHFHPEVLAALQLQTWRWPLHLPANWPTQPGSRVKPLHLPFHILNLPTYASWTNPIEKLWRLLKQEVLHLHPFADDWSGLKVAVTDFLDTFAAGSKELLHYVGLSDPSKLYRSLFPA